MEGSQEGMLMERTTVVQTLEFKRQDLQTSDGVYRKGREGVNSNEGGFICQDQHTMSIKLIFGCKSHHMQHVGGTSA